MRRSIDDISHFKPLPRSVHKNPSIAFLENIELQLLDKLRDIQMEWENKKMAEELLRGPLKSVEVRRELEKIAGILPTKNI